MSNYCCFIISKPRLIIGKMLILTRNQKVSGSSLPHSGGGGTGVFPFPSAFPFFACRIIMVVFS